MLVGAAVPAWSGDVRVSFSNGRVTIVAADASPRQILTEWAKLGQVRITNLERLAGSPVTIQLMDVPEPQALETLLRGTAGYVAAPRRAAGDIALSRYDRILLMPGAAPVLPVVTPGGASPASPAPTRGRPVQPAGRPDDGAAGQPRPAPGTNQRQFFPTGVQGPGRVGQSPGQYFAPSQSQPGYGTMQTQQPGMQTPATQIPTYSTPQAPGATGTSVPGMTTAPVPLQTTPYSNARPPFVVQPSDSGTYANPYALPSTVQNPATPAPATTPGATTPGAATPGAMTPTVPIKKSGEKG